MTRTLLPACLGALLIAPDGRAQETVDLPGEDGPLAAELVEVYRIGSVNAVAEWQVLGTVRAAGFDESGNLYFLDAPARVVVVDSGGNFLREIGRPGEGPGEFRRPEQLNVLPSGRIVVTDPFVFQIFGADGVFERTVSVKVDPSNISGIGAFLRAASFGARPARDGAAIFSDGIRKIMRTDLSSDEARIDTFVEAWAPPGTEGVVSGSMADMASAVLWGLEPPLVFDALPGGGIAFSDSSAYAIKVTGPSGEVLRVLHRPIDPGASHRPHQTGGKGPRVSETGLVAGPGWPGASGHPGTGRGIPRRARESHRGHAVLPGSAGAACAAHHLGRQFVGPAPRRGTGGGPRTDRRTDSGRSLSRHAQPANPDAGRIRS